MDRSKTQRVSERNRALVFSPERHDALLLFLQRASTLLRGFDYGLYVLLYFIQHLAAIRTPSIADHLSSPYLARDCHGNLRRLCYMPCHLFYALLHKTVKGYGAT